LVTSLTKRAEKKPAQKLVARANKVDVYASSIALTGHCAAHAPQSTQRSALISYCPSPSKIASQGQTLWQLPQEMQSDEIL